MLSIESILSTVPDYLKKYANIIFAKVDFDKLVAKTSASDIWILGQATSKGFSLNNMSNILRLVLLLKFGGVYFDSDVISVKSLPLDKQGNIIWFLIVGYMRTVNYYLYYVRHEPCNLIINLLNSDSNLFIRVLLHKFHLF